MEKHILFLFCMSFFGKLEIGFCGDDTSSDAFLQAIDHLINSAAKIHYMSGGNISVPIVLRGPKSAALGIGAQHSQTTCASVIYNKKDLDELDDASSKNLSVLLGVLSLPGLFI
ncbi:hypothetical protein RND71_003395 [Anisodus tanguticus]|uniref:Pyruvate dehydrogenase E1 component subunit beta n=1 Tax=Anisodus tanguticus TaxID=243964 RepID=A0AAE1SUI2_9SOLA|nr:hypothetical protein RND71_003395 [Anisodus tanguticus]